MIFIVEIPHQRPVSCWIATNEADFCARMAEAYQRHGDTPEDWGDFPAWRDYLASDLHRLHVFMTDAEALTALDDSTFDGHQGGRARQALEDKLRSYGLIAEPEEAEE